MRISDWSSDVCSSDLYRAAARRTDPCARRCGQHPDFGVGAQARNDGTGPWRDNLSLPDNRRSIEACGAGLPQGCRQAFLLRRITSRASSTGFFLRLTLTSWQGAKAEISHEERFYGATLRPSSAYERSEEPTSEIQS